MVALSKLDADRFARIDRKLGDLSYPIYLNQYAVFIAAANLTSEISFRVQIAAVVSTLVLSWVLAVVIERPLVPLRDRWRERRLGQPPRRRQSRCKPDAIE